MNTKQTQKISDWQAWADLLSFEELEMAANASGLTYSAGKSLNRNAMRRFDKLCYKLKMQKLGLAVNANQASTATNETKNN